MLKKYNQILFIGSLFLILLYTGLLYADNRWLLLQSTGGVQTDSGIAIKSDIDGNVVNTGFFADNVNFGPYNLIVDQQEDVFTAKMNLDSNVYEWVKQQGKFYSDKGLAVVTDNLGECYISGQITQGSNLYYYAYVSKINKSGNILWTKEAVCSSNSSAQAIALDSNKDIYLAGIFKSSITLGSYTLTANTKDEIFIAKLDSNGNFLWAKQAGGTDADMAYGITCDSNNNIYITGGFGYNSSTLVGGTASFGSTNLTATQDCDIFIAKLDSDGNFLWAKKAGGNGHEFAKSISIDSANNCYITGQANNDVVFESATLTNIGNNDAFIAKYDQNGNFIWAKNGGGAGSDAGKSIATDIDGTSYVSGLFANQADFGTSTIMQSSTTANFLTKIDKDGNFVWAKAVGNGSTDNGVAIDSKGNVFMTGGYSGNLTLDGFTANSNGGSVDIFMAKFDDRSTIYVSGEITQDSTWNADSVIVVGDVSVADNAVLNIKPNTVVKFQDSFNISVNGAIRAIGTYGNEIVFSGLDSIHKSGGFVFLETTDADTSLFKHCIFKHLSGSVSKSDSTDAGGVIRIQSGNTISVIDCDFDEDEVVGIGGAIYVNGASFTMVNCVVSHNHSGLDGGAIYFENCSPLVVNSTFVYNKANENGGALVFKNSDGNFYNNIFYYNQAHIGKQIYLSDNDSDPDFFNCDIEGGFDGFGGPGAGANYSGAFQNNLYSIPLFAANSYELTDVSPCIDKGTQTINSPGFMIPERDKVDNPRINAAKIDIGAYEFMFPSQILDVVLTKGMELSQNYPNPFNATTTISFRISKPENVELSFLNIKGEEVLTKVSRYFGKGKHELTVNCSELSGGLYFYKLKTKSGEQIKKMLYLK